MFDPWYEDEAVNQRTSNHSASWQNTIICDWIILPILRRCWWFLCIQIFQLSYSFLEIFLITCGIVHIEVCWYFDNVPCAWLPVVGEVHMVLIVEQTQAHLVPREGPRTKLHDTSLLVKWEVCHIYRTWGLKIVQNVRFAIFRILKNLRMKKEILE